jgi:hypothetical protein
MTPARLQLLSELVDEFIVEHATNWMAAPLGRVHAWVQEARDHEVLMLTGWTDDDEVIGVPV